MIEQEQARKNLQGIDSTVELVDIDYAIQKYIEETIGKTFSNPSNKQDVRIKVMMKNPERWIDKKDLSDIKDITGNHYTFPIIGISRTGIDIIKNKVPHWLKDEDLSYIVNKKFNSTYRKDGDPYYRMVRRPIYIDASYEFEIISDSRPHVNHIVEQFLYNEGKYWSDGEKYSFRTTFGSVLDGSISASGEQERLIINSISATCKGRIIPKYVEGEEKSVSFIQSVSKVELDEKVVPHFTNDGNKNSIWD